MELYEELESLRKQLDASIRSLRKTGSEAAQAEHDYKVLLAQECLKLRDEGMAVGMIGLVCYGIPSIALARLKRDISDSVYTANKEAIAGIKLQMRIVEAQIEREWSGAGKGDM